MACYARVRIRAVQDSWRGGLRLNVSGKVCVNDGLWFCFVPNAISLIARLFVALNWREKKFITRKLDGMRTKNRIVYHIVILVILSIEGGKIVRRKLGIEIVIFNIKIQWRYDWKTQEFEFFVINNRNKNFKDNV